MGKITSQFLHCIPVVPNLYVALSRLVTAPLILLHFPLQPFNNVSLYRLVPKSLYIPFYR